MLGNELWNKINEQKRTVEFLCYLYERWQDEKAHEDINDYLKALQKTIPQAYKMTKRPFGVVCKCDNCDLHVYVKQNGYYLELFAEEK